MDGSDESREYQGDSPGPPMEEAPDSPAAVDRPGTTADEQRESSMERRLAMEEPDRGGSARADEEPRAIVDGDVSTEDLVVEDVNADPEEADLDRESAEVGELSTDPAVGAEEAAIHIEDE